MLQQINFSQILFIDIETVSMQPDYESLSEQWKKLWNKKAAHLKSDEQTGPEALYERAGIYAEFGKIVCISAGYLNGAEFRIKSFFGDDEKILLEDFARLLNRHFSNPDNLLCAHNGKEFDFPYIARRMLINGIDLPVMLQIAGKKPWEIRHLDTMELWKFGDYKNYTSLELLTAVFGIPTPKDDIDGSMVGKIYWHDRDIERIRHYCQKDVLAIAQLLRCYLNQSLIRDESVVVI
jgi:3'-5' exonuclease